MQYLGEELSKYGKNVQLIYGGGSIKKNGIYEQVMELLKANGKAVGSGSCCDYAKAVSVSVHCEEEPWEKYYIRFEEPSCGMWMPMEKRLQQKDFPVWKAG